MGSISIDARTSQTVTAPAPVWLTATSVTELATTSSGGVYRDAAFHDFTYIWTVRGKPLAAADKPNNMVPEWNDPNVAYGRDVAFCLTDPGTYDIDVWAVDRDGTTAEGTVQIVVADADAIYPGASTIALALNGDFTGAPTGATQVTSLSALYSAIDSRTAPTRISLKRGEDLGATRIFTDGRLEHVDVWGSGARPIIRGNNDLTSSGNIRGPLQLWRGCKSQQLIVTGINFVGDWDPTTELGAHRGVSPVSTVEVDDQNIDFLVHDCLMSGWDALRPDNPHNQGNHSMVAHCAIIDWNGYGMLYDAHAGNRAAVIWNKIAQHPQAFHGGPKGGLHAVHGPIRLEDADNVYIAGNDLFSRTGWSGAPPGLADQPCIRINADGALNTTYVIERNVMEGGNAVIRSTGQNSDVVDQPANHLIERNLFLATIKTYIGFCEIQQPCTIRNNIGVLFDADPDLNGSGSLQGGASGTQFRPVDVRITNPGNGVADEPIDIYNNTFYSAMSAANDPGRLWQIDVSDFTNSTVENNVLHAPNMDMPVTGDAPIDTSTAIAGVTPRWQGIRYGFERVLHRLSADLANGGGVLIPYATFTQRKADGSDNEGTTDQAYWQTYGGTRHGLTASINPGNQVRSFHAHFGEIAVAFEAGGIRITNLSGQTWYANIDLALQLDRDADQNAMNTATANPAIVPLPVPTGASNAVGTGDAGQSSYDDVFFTRRPESGRSRGAIEVAG